jgi:molybdopterin-binding protein
MSRIKATVKNIKNFDNLNLVEFDCNGLHLTMISLEIDDTIKLETKVILNIKSTALMLAKSYEGFIGTTNKFHVTITNIDKGALLCCVQCSYFNNTFETIITKDVYENMQLKLGDSAQIFIKESDISIAEVLDV